MFQKQSIVAPWIPKILTFYLFIILSFLVGGGGGVTAMNIQWRGGKQEFFPEGFDEIEQFLKVCNNLLRISLIDFKCISRHLRGVKIRVFWGSVKNYRLQF